MTPSAPRSEGLTDWLVLAVSLCLAATCVAGILRAPATVQLQETMPTVRAALSPLRILPSQTLVNSAAPPEPLLTSRPPTAPALVLTKNQDPNLSPLAKLPVGISNATPVALNPELPAGPGGNPMQLERAQLGGLQPWPTYPPEAVRRQEQGTVSIRFSVGSKGEVSDVRILKSSGWRSLDQSASETIRQRWSFPTATPRDYTIDIRFELR